MSKDQTEERATFGYRVFDRLMRSIETFNEADGEDLLQLAKEHFSVLCQFG